MAGDAEQAIDFYITHPISTEIVLKNLRGRRLRRQRSNALLLGRLFDDRGNPMSPSYAIKKGVRYRYYVSCVLAQGRKEEAGSVSRVAAETVEQVVLDAIETFSSTNAFGAQSDALSVGRPAPRQGPDAAEDAKRTIAALERATVTSEV
jgi:hypothetical protein